AVKKEKSESEETPVEHPLNKLTKFLTVPANVPIDQADIVDTQADLSQSAVAEMLIYHRTIGDRFKMIEGRATGEIIERFANRISLLTWANNRRSRGEAVELGMHLRSDDNKERIEIEHLGGIPPISVPVEPQKKKRLKII
ncbi:unnamed protein product, partial [marine sediment metagenome]